MNEEVKNYISSYEGEKDIIPDKILKLGDLSEKIAVKLCEKTNLIVYLHKNKRYNIEELKRKYLEKIY